LAIAVVAAVLLDVLLLVSFGWTELIGPDLRTTLWTGLGVVWVGAAVWSVSWSRKRAGDRKPEPQQDVFGEALDHYLQGDYFQTEQILEGLLRRNVRDVDARLMLATLLRHTGRLDDAARQLDTLARFEGAGKWELEIRQERELLAKAKKQPEAAAENETGTASGDARSANIGHAA
jgi:predicted Zn-dependent protease